MQRSINVDEVRRVDLGGPGLPRREFGRTLPAEGTGTNRPQTRLGRAAKANPLTRNNQLCEMCLAVGGVAS